jgi:hypothetical protein
MAGMFSWSDDARRSVVALRYEQFRVLSPRFDPIPIGRLVGLPWSVT